MEKMLRPKNMRQRKWPIGHCMIPEHKGRTIVTSFWREPKATLACIGGPQVRRSMHPVVQLGALWVRVRECAKLWGGLASWDEMDNQAGD
jgi:hypothetical protein